ncbi:PBECR4 domain-containing protein [Streptococcus uberis]|nr:PBECR4 domain-containing protein [Streptococcus uberis]MCK1202946.1 PBECR4 domain-containing protein [Streptococcus uberis]
MSYYELHKDKLQDVRLVAMDGLKEATISRYFMELQAEITNSSYEVNWKETPSALEKVAQVTDFFKNGKNNSVITLAVDNDKAGKEFVNKLHNKGINCETDFPPLISGKVKSDWNDIVKQEKINKKKHEEIQDLIDTVESLSQTAYFWVSEEDLNKPSEVVSALDGWFSSDKVETAYNSEFFELIVGDYTYMIEFKNKELSLQNIEEYSKYISNRINEIGFESTIKELEMIITDFNQVKLAISSEMDKQIDLIRNRLSKEKSPEESQEHRKMDRSKISSGFLQENLEGSTLPVSNDTFEQTVTSHPTVSYPLLHFSTDNITVSNTRAGYHVATETDLRNLNYYAPALQSTATWYRDILSNSKVTYLLKGEDEHPKEVIVDFSKDKFAHLTGIRPIGSGLNAEKVLDDLVEGRGHYPNISVSHGFIDKVQVLPLLQEITMSKSFVFDHLEEIAKMRSLKASHVIQSENKNLIVALKTVDDVTFPASLLKSKGTINNQLIENAKENEILGVVRQRNNRTEIISINDKYITDGGQELLEIVKQRGKDLSPKKDPKQDIVIDSDADGLSDEVEYGLGTDPFSEGILDDKPQLVNSETIKEMIADNKTKDLSMTLKEGIKNFLDSEQYKQFLKTMSQFHHYSPRNIQLLLAQNPTVNSSCKL